MHYIKKKIIINDVNVGLDCGDPTPINGVANYDAGTTLGETATIVCDTGYNLNGSDLLTCTDSGWNDTSSCAVTGIFLIIFSYIF